MSLDHLIPRSRGGSNRIDNLKLAHVCCNVRRANELPFDDVKEQRNNALADALFQRLGADAEKRVDIRGTAMYAEM